MIAELLGGKVSQNSLKEIGWHKVRSLETFRADDNLFHISEEIIAFQWHGDTFSLPKGAKCLFESEACPEQGFIYGDNVLAVQFHPEVDEECVDSLIENCSSDLVKSRFVQSENEIRGRDDLIRSSSDLMFAILDWFESNIRGKTN